MSPKYLITTKHLLNRDLFLQALQKAKLTGAETVTFEPDLKIWSDWRRDLKSIIEEATSFGFKCEYWLSPEDFLNFREELIDQKISVETLYASVFYSGVDILRQQLSSILAPTAAAKYRRLVLRPRSVEENWWPMIEKLSEHSALPIVDFDFAPYSANQPTSLTTPEVFEFVGQYNSKYSPYKAKRPEGLGFWDSRIEEGLELESFRSPDFELIYSSESKLESKSESAAANCKKISVVIPTHNAKYFLWSVLQHLYLQDRDKDSFEVIVVDDGGNDGALDYIQGAMKRAQWNWNFKYIYWPKPPAKNPQFPIHRAGHARNLGAYHAQGELLLFLDSDIITPPHFLDDLEASLARAEVIQYTRYHIRPNLSHAGVKYQLIDPEKDLYVEEPSYWGPFFESNDWNLIPNHWKYTCTYCLAMSKKHFQQAGRFRRTYSTYGFEDTEIGYQLAKLGLKFELNKLKTYHLTPFANNSLQLGRKYFRHQLLSRTAQIFYLNNLEPVLFTHFRGFMTGERSLWQSLKLLTTINSFKNH